MQNPHCLVAPTLHKTVFIALLAVFMTTQITGCFPLIAGAMVGTSLAATDRRTLGTQLEDRQIQLKAENIIANSMQGENVNVTVFNRRVLLTGQTPTPELKNKAEQLAAAIENVKQVINALEVTTASSLISRSNDALLTSKVKATFVDAKDVFANAFKITSERGTVYLMGRVTQTEADRAADLTSRIAGVSKVVKVLDVISEAELKQLQKEPAKASTTTESDRIQ